MTTEQSVSAVQRKLAAASSGTQSGERTALRALRLGFARAAATVFDLPLAVIGTTQRRADTDDVADHIRDDWLLLLLDGADGQIGAMLFCPDSIAALIQHQTMGAVSGSDNNGAAKNNIIVETCELSRSGCRHQSHGRNSGGGKKEFHIRLLKCQKSARQKVRRDISQIIALPDYSGTPTSFVPIAWCNSHAETVARLT